MDLRFRLADLYDSRGLLRSQVGDMAGGDRRLYPGPGVSP
jgi:hypothetical protein